MSNVVGYARVSTREQNPEVQTAELRAAGAARVFVDHGESSRIADRPQWSACLDYLRHRAVPRRRHQYTDGRGHRRHHGRPGAAPRRHDPRKH